MTHRKTVDIRQYLEFGDKDSPEAAIAAAEKIAAALNLRLAREIAEDCELEEIVERIATIATEDDPHEELERCLEDLYDWAEENDVFLGPRAFVRRDDGEAARHDAEQAEA